jgi:hypothetical protein
MIDCLTPCCTCCRTSSTPPQESVGQSTESPPPSAANNDKTEISTNMNNLNCDSPCNVQRTVQSQESLHSETENNNLERLEGGLSQRSVIQSENSSFKRGRKIRDFESTSDFGNSSHSLLCVRNSEQKSEIVTENGKENETRKNESSGLSFSINIVSNDENENENGHQNESIFETSNRDLTHESESELFGVSTTENNVDNYMLKNLEIDL